MIESIVSACGSNVGRIRKNNEDNFYYLGKTLPEVNSGLGSFVYSSKTHLSLSQFFAVMDGMGGEEAGEKASYIAARTAADCLDEVEKTLFSPREFLASMCEKMNHNVCEESKKLPYGSMGSTLASLMFFSEEVYACNVGDSKIFRLRDNELLQISEDHSEQLPEGVTRKPRLTQHLGMPEDEIQLEPYIAKGKLLPGDKYLICSDGLTDMVSNLEIHFILNSCISIQSCVKKLIQKAIKNGGKDNCTVIVCSVE